MDAIKESISKHWNENTCDFDKALNFDDLDKKMFDTYPYAEKMLRMESSGGKDVLEIGVGSACSPCRMITKYKPKSYTLYDISPKTLEIASDHLTQHCGGYKFKTIQGDMEDMSAIPDKSVDRVIAIGSIHHTNTPLYAMKEISRILRDDGDFAFMFYNRDSLEYKYVIPRMIKRGTKDIINVDEWVRKFDGPTNPIGIALSRKEVKNMCKRVGLKITNMETRELRGFNPISVFKKYRINPIPIKILRTFLANRYGISLYVWGDKQSGN